MKSLSGIRVLDLSRVLAGPYCTMMMADHGAEVIKIELPGTGDDSRAFTPIINGESAYFASINRGKKSVTVNLKHDEGKEIIRKLAAVSDVIVENFRPGTMEKLGLGYEQLKEINPSIIYACGSGYGHSGPWSKRPAYDLVIQALSGFMSITGQEGSIPTKAGPSIMDIMTGIFLYAGITTALYAREKTGLGQQVDVAMLDYGVAILENALVRYTQEGEIPTRIGNRHSSITPFESFRAKDDYFVIACGNDTLFFKMCQLIGKETIAADERFKTNVLRTRNQKVLYILLERVFETRTVDEWVTLFDSEGIPAAPINSVDRLLANPQLQERNMLIDMEHPVIGAMKLTGTPIKLDGTPGSLSTPAPGLGQHTEEILKSILKFEDSRLEDLKKSCVI
jgi:CoA:oxalate CoA-transferase